MVFLFLILIIIVLFILAISVSKQKEPQRQSPRQPAYFDLQDDNGDPLPQQSEEPTVQELQHFCVKDKGYHVSVWPKDQGYQGIDYLEFNIAGLSHHASADYLGEHVGTMEAEPDNPYDPNAIKILTTDGHQVGYVPKDVTDEVRNFTLLPCRCYIYIGLSDEGIYYSDCYINSEKH